MPPKPARILVIDDVPDFLQEIRSILRPQYLVTICSSPRRALRLLLDEEFDLVVTTLVMREMDGFEVIRRTRGSGFKNPVILVTGYGNEATSVEALRLGATDYLNKPVAPEELLVRVERALAAFQAGQEPWESAIISHHPEVLETIRLTQKIASSPSRVLILGETGTGKELFARLLHEKSKKKQQPFVVINCAAIPSNLLESELFGHERGAFTGATERRTGRFEEAGEGTLFLDEIGELSMALQSKLLRVLQTGEFSRVGSSKSLISRARILAATNRNLEEEVQAGRFRADLYYRLNVVTLHIPPLRQRGGDIPLLLEHFARRYQAPSGTPVRFSKRSSQLLCAHAWPGNVRELEHLVERLSVLYPGALIEPEHLGPTIRRDPLRVEEKNRGFHAALREFEVAYFTNLLSQTEGNMAQAARLARLDRGQFFRKLVALGVHKPGRVR